MPIFDQTITALSTPPGKGGVALIRLSGSEAFAIADAVFKAKNGKAVAALPPRYATYGDVYLDGEAVDDVLLTRFPAPHSYTGEDTVEITSHGGRLVTEAILTALYQAGAAPAGKGEFTRRAYTQGKLSLSEAEAIGELLDARSMAQIKLFGRDSRSKLSKTLGEIYEDVRELLSALCAAIDYPDEDLAELSPHEVLDRILKAEKRGRALLATYGTGRAITEGIETVLLGKPNVGKSTLYNLLCGKDAAIVTELAGTTRDLLETTVPLGRVLLRLTDTAGVREAEDPIERIGVSRAKAAAESASLILALFDASAPADAEDQALLSFLDTLPLKKIALLNKCDLGNRFETSLLEGRVDAVIPFSAKQEDPQKITDIVNQMFTNEEIQVGEDAILFSARGHAALSRGCDCLATAAAALRSGAALDAALCDLELALSALSETDGKAVGEDVVAGIFSKFCVGK